ncbi:uncharacterized protein I303_103548 [Kwoniella dejecticola CBS 10117]|uniref:BTB domain-containing protein n=1 Tax=Kwoniella dejecticola CBS 10117 TaxID=1296121 RepID=A0A1A6A724_9TREE|nr:uncharacterized protein I303_03570 [Kwoniella dejecticola CBS 10117]OBR85856.1 hypothetical protein I303_03570 [Kwoniella dejecticola CBS 10117]
MPNLHVHYHNGNVKAFRQELDGSSNTSNTKGNNVNPGSASGGGKSWSMNGFIGVPVKTDINERDQHGRTVLHLAASATASNAYTFFSILLRNPNISVNLQDTESGYTALHRALFVGNLRAARDLLARNDIDLNVKDYEGMTAFDLYNGTVEGTNPPHDVDGSDLYVWGVNRNYSLGTGDGSDKSFPDHINLLTQAQANGRSEPSEKFDHVGVSKVVMAKLHTGAITTEPRGNLSLCGFGSNGRLGRPIHSQLALAPLQELSSHTIVDIALGQDHTLALASGGYILSWGHNRFSQLGYTIEVPDKPIPGSRDDDLVQVSPKRIVGPLKKEIVRGVAAGRMNSACWTADAVWTWGTNAGHLGYDKASNPVQIVPRRVTSITQPVLDIAFTDYAMICLLDSYEVLCFHRDTSFKISFSTPRVLSEAFPFRPPQATLKPMIRKVTSCGTSFAALSSIGDVFTFSLPNPLDDLPKDARGGHVSVKPQMIWALRKSFTAVQDVALGSDGTVIICTQSGHVFVRQRLKSGSGQLKFRRIPYLQRVIKVAVNESGAFAAIRLDAKAKPIALTGRTLEEDLYRLQPHIKRFESQMTADEFEEALKKKVEDEDEDESSNSIAKDLAEAFRFCTMLSRWRNDEGDSLFAWSDPLLGSDVHIVVNDIAIPAHSVILSTRVPKLKQLLAGKTRLDRVSLSKYRSSQAISLKVCHPLVALLLLQYIYTDDISAIWDARVARAVQDKFAALKLPLGDIKSDLRALADELNLAPLSQVLSSAGKQPISHSTLPSDLYSFFTSTYTTAPWSSNLCDVTLVLADKEVTCNSTVLRARCPFFEAMFADSDWTSRRQGDGKVTVHMEHLKWASMKLIFRYIHEGAEDDLFDYLHQETLDEFLDFVFEVLAAATELLLDRLVLVCSRAIIKPCNAFNAAALATEAAFYQADTLKLSIFDYIIACMETMLESGLLDEMDADVLQDLSDVIAQKQSVRLSVSRNQVLVKAAMEKHREWLSLQDIPQPRVRQSFRWKPRSPALSPVDTMSFSSAKKEKRRNANTIPSSPLLSPEMLPSAADGIFQMDDEPPTPPSTSSGAVTPRVTRPVTPLDLAAVPGQGKSAVWRSKTVETEKVDLRSIMAGEVARKTPQKSTAMSTGARPQPTPLPTPTKSASSARSPPSSSSPWRPMDVSRTSLSSVQAQQSPSPSFSLARPSGSQASPVPQRTGSSKVITPVKLSTPSSTSSSSIVPATQRKASGSAGGAAWTTPAFTPTPPVSVSPVTQGFSLLAIQQHERDIAEMSSKKPARSLKEIQEEEKQQEKDKAQEDEFMRWWAEEEARVATQSGAGSSAGGRGGKANRGGKVRSATTKGKAGAGGGAKTLQNGAQKNGENTTGVIEQGEKPKSEASGNARARGGKAKGASNQRQDANGVQILGRSTNASTHTEKNTNTPPKSKTQSRPANGNTIPNSGAPRNRQQQLNDNGRTPSHQSDPTPPPNISNSSNIASESIPTQTPKLQSQTLSQSQLSATSSTFTPKADAPAFVPRFVSNK